MWEVFNEKFSFCNSYKVVEIIGLMLCVILPNYPLWTPVGSTVMALLSFFTLVIGVFFFLIILVFFQFSSVTQLCPTLCDPMNRSTPGLPVHHQLPEFTQTHAHRVGDAIQPFHPLSSPSPPAPNPSQHQGLFQWVNSSYDMAKVLEFQLQHQSFQWTPRTDLLQGGLVGSPCSPRDS